MPVVKKMRFIDMTAGELSRHRGYLAGQMKIDREP